MPDDYQKECKTWCPSGKVWSTTQNKCIVTSTTNETYSLFENQSLTAVVGGTTYSVTSTFIGSTQAKFTINGVSTNLIYVGSTQNVAGVYISVTSIDSQAYAGGARRVGFQLSKTFVVSN